MASSLNSPSPSRFILWMIYLIFKMFCNVDRQKESSLISKVFLRFLLSNSPPHPRQKTGAYIELQSDPLWTVFDKVVHLLNNRRSKDQILAWQLDKMMPKREKVALAYLYFIPKSHKVMNIHILSLSSSRLHTHCFFFDDHRKVLH
jgi:hypothetical protein